MNALILVFAVTFLLNYAGFLRWEKHMSGASHAVTAGLVGILAVIVTLVLWLLDWLAHGAIDWINGLFWG